jgi:hypothetical protein
MRYYSEGPSITVLLPVFHFYKLLVSELQPETLQTLMSFIFGSNVTIVLLVPAPTRKFNLHNVDISDNNFFNIHLLVNSVDRKLKYSVGSSDTKYACTGTTKRYNILYAFVLCTCIYNPLSLFVCLTTLTL